MGLARFGKMGNNRKMFSKETRSKKIGDIIQVRFQYMQLRSLVFVPLREGNIFRPPTTFEELLAVQGKKIL